MTLVFSNVDDVRSKMNEWGRLGKPYLFGVDYELSEGFLVENPLQQSDLFFKMGDVGNVDMYEKHTRKPARFVKHPIGYEKYKEKFDIVHKGLQRGDSFLTNLTIKTPIETDTSFGDIFVHSHALYKLYIPDRFVCFSPERFVRIVDGVISSNPMKGTIDADIENAEQTILGDFKETAEHNTIVDLIRNDLSIVADEVKVARFRYVDRIETNNKNILQVSSEITGQLYDGYLSRLGDIVLGMLPAGSICGAPKDSTVKLARMAEGESRGFYTGVFGYFDGRELDSAVLIRYIENDGDKLFFRSGGGITAYSDCQSEYNEVLDKIYLPVYG